MTRPNTHLSDRQVRLVQQHAAALPVQQRSEFLRQIADHLSANPTNAAVEAAVNAALDRIHAFTNNNTHS